MAQRLARSAVNRKAVGSNPIWGDFFFALRMAKKLNFQKKNKAPRGGLEPPTLRLKV